jgi:molybdopterin biosynthesis enzyme
VQLRAVRAKLAHDYDHAGGRAACLPARLSEVDSERVVEILPWQGSADIATLASATGLVCLPTEKRHFEAGSGLDVLPL